MQYQISKFVQVYCSFLRGKGWSIQVSWFYRFRWKFVFRFITLFIHEKKRGVKSTTDIQRHSEGFSCVDQHFWRVCMALKVCRCFILPITRKHFF